MVKIYSSNITNSSGNLVAGLIPDHPPGAHLKLGLAEDFDHQVGRLAGGNAQSNPTTLGPVVATPCLELNSAASHNTSSHQVAVELLLLREPDHIEDALRVEHLLVIVLPNALEEEEEEEVAPRLARPRWGNYVVAGWLLQKLLASIVARQPRHKLRAWPGPGRAMPGLAGA